MAITAAALQAQLGTRVTDPRVQAEIPPYGGIQQHWVVTGGMTYKGRWKRRISTTAADNAATQAAAVVAALADGATF